MLLCVKKIKCEYVDVDVGDVDYDVVFLGEDDVVEIMMKIMKKKWVFKKVKMDDGDVEGGVWVKVKDENVL